jgi:hypothetical protein
VYRQGYISGLRIGNARFPEIAAAISSQALPDDPANGIFPLSVFGEVYIDFRDDYVVMQR